MNNITNEKYSDQTSQVELYVVSLKKFTLLYIFTFGLYLFYWLYKHWALYQQSTSEKLMPKMRTIFSILFIHQLFNIFESRYEKKTGVKPKSIKPLATVYVIFSLFSSAIHLILDSESDHIYLLLLNFFMHPIYFWVLFKSQSLANYSGEDVLGETNSKLTLYNYVWMVLISALSLYSYYTILSS